MASTDQIISTFVVLLGDIGHDLPHPLPADVGALDLETDLQFDSLDALELAIAINNEFQIDLPKLDDVRTLRQLADVVSQQLSLKEARAE